ncbi:hypothetical protein VOLCADRAFT_95918 [Volvox carteri f. nagariensis]|uniref:Uncharacterized protein n=1 Tax=Volvox carteri f. nagariensis TaxID=3068 RepID=D8U8Q1_VOLCA|nr:uncharacterized protein VOLCADRAFT_95918 [Volvox carteri f. nagariensis]EFJ43845.1 hypothetical protein VOLCADRAFT_95918 [Volvox carteri f. nagariensis]|eukprot:XP_002955091.1 hypothetical protein VOLCADRAFT_95918 [Volvox carteri f. nagariensis]
MQTNVTTPIMTTDALYSHFLSNSASFHVTAVRLRDPRPAARPCENSRIKRQIKPKWQQVITRISLCWLAGRCHSETAVFDWIRTFAPAAAWVVPRRFAYMALARRIRAPTGLLGFVRRNRDGTFKLDLIGMESPSTVEDELTASNCTPQVGDDSHGSAQSCADSSRWICKAFLDILRQHIIPNLGRFYHFCEAAVDVDSKATANYASPDGHEHQPEGRVACEAWAAIALVCSDWSAAQLQAELGMVESPLSDMTDTPGMVAAVGDLLYGNDGCNDSTSDGSGGLRPGRAVSLRALEADGPTAVPLLLLAAAELPLLESVTLRQLPATWFYVDGALPWPAAAAERLAQLVPREVYDSVTDKALYGAMYGAAMKRRFRPYWVSYDGALAALLYHRGRHLRHLSLEAPSRLLSQGGAPFLEYLCLEGFGLRQEPHTAPRVPLHKAGLRLTALNTSANGGEGVRGGAALAVGAAAAAAATAATAAEEIAEAAQAGGGGGVPCAPYGGCGCCLAHLELVSCGVEPLQADVFKGLTGLTRLTSLAELADITLQPDPAEGPRLQPPYTGLAALTCMDTVFMYVGRATSECRWDSEGGDEDANEDADGDDGDGSSSSSSSDGVVRHGGSAPRHRNRNHGCRHVHSRRTWLRGSINHLFPALSLLTRLMFCGGCDEEHGDGEDDDTSDNNGVAHFVLQAGELPRLRELVLCQGLVGYGRLVLVAATSLTRLEVDNVEYLDVRYLEVGGIGGDGGGWGVESAESGFLFLVVGLPPSLEYLSLIDMVGLPELYHLSVDNMLVAIAQAGYMAAAPDPAAPAACEPASGRGGGGTSGGATASVRWPFPYLPALEELDVACLVNLPDEDLDRVLLSCPSLRGVTHRHGECRVSRDLTGTTWVRRCTAAEGDGRAADGGEG